MKRFLLDNLVTWKSKNRRLPLILKGARQVGKTYLIDEFGRQNFNKTHKFNFEANPKLRIIFENDLDPSSILKELELQAQTNITEDDLIFFDEIQDCPKALTSLKYFSEKLPKFALISAGSLLGITLPDVSFPVGKVEYLWLGPMTFEEFLLGTENQKGIEIYRQLKESLKITPFAHDYLWSTFKIYYITGGLPMSILTYIKHKHSLIDAWTNVRQTQESLIRDYTSDFSKYTQQTNAVHIRAIYENIPEQLARSEDRTTNKYIFSKAIAGKRGLAELSSPIAWLVSSGLTYKVRIANKAQLPLALYSKANFFKLYHFDIGILGALLRLPPAALLTEDYGMAKGYFAESLALQALVKNELQIPFCWMEGQSEIEFLLTTDWGPVPVEVKSSYRTKAKSFDSYVKKYSPKIAIKLANCLPKYNKATRVQQLPLYLAWELEGILPKIIEQR